MIVPCEGCLLVPLCKHRSYRKLFEHCSLLKEYEPHPVMMRLRDNEKIDMIQKTLKPTRWYMKKDGLFIQSEIYGNTIRNEANQ